MNPELSVILFAVDVGLLVILLAGAAWSVAFPGKRAWPPPQRRWAARKDALGSTS